MYSLFILRCWRREGFQIQGRYFRAISQKRYTAYQYPEGNLVAMTRSPNVAIIGAGFAGLRCADILVQNGAQVTIFEARNRLGGRVFQTKVGDHLVDLGANWIHGTGNNPIAAVAEATNTTIEDFEGNQIMFSRDGKQVDENTATKVSEFIWTTIDEAYAYSNANKDNIPPERSLLDFITEKVEKANLSPMEKELCLDSCRLWGLYIGDPVERQSLKFFCLEECLDGNNFFVSSTYKNILEHVSKAAIQHADIRYNQPIVKIETKSQEDPTTPRKVILTTAAGESHDFDEVVVTCPLGWLKRNKSAFIPQLPPRLTQAINSISYGRLEKVYVTFPRAFWHSQAGALKSTPTDAKHTAHENLAFAQFINPAYTDHPKDIIWHQECLSFAGRPAHCAHPTLLFYTHGPCATHIVSKISSLDPSSEEFYTFLDNFLRPFYSRLSGYSSSSEECKPLAFVATQWQNDPYAGNGSYCNFQVGLEQGDRDIEALRGGGIGPERGIWFAGEHTAPFVALGTTTGAYWSGERAAGQICQFHGLGMLGIGAGRDDSLPSAVWKGVFGYGGDLGE